MVSGVPVLRADQAPWKLVAATPVGFPEVPQVLADAIRAQPEIVCVADDRRADSQAHLQLAPRTAHGGNRRSVGSTSAEVQIVGSRGVPEHDVLEREAPLVSCPRLDATKTEGKSGTAKAPRLPSSVAVRRLGLVIPRYRPARANTL